MKAKFLKIAKVKSEKDFYKKYPTEEAFFKAHPEARMLKDGGAATADQFFDYGLQATGPWAAPETWYQDGGQYGGQTQLGGEAGDVDYSFINEFANSLYPDTQEELAESAGEEATEDESTEDTSMDQYAYGGSLRKFISGGEDVIYPPGFDPITGKHQLRQGEQPLTKDQLLDYFKLSNAPGVIGGTKDITPEYINPEGSYVYYKPIPYVAPVQQNVQRTAKMPITKPVSQPAKESFFEKISSNLTAPRSHYNIGRRGIGQKKYFNPSRFAEEGGSFQMGGSKSAFNYGQFPALNSGGIQGGNIDAAGSNIKENFLAGIRKYVADNEVEKLKNTLPTEETNMGMYAQYGAQSGYGANYNPNLYNQEAFQNAYEQGQGKTQAGFNQLQDVLGQNINYSMQQKYAEQQAKKQKTYNDALRKFVSDELAKNVPTPTGDIVSKPVDAGQQTIDLAPNTTNIWGTQPSFKTGGSLKKYQAAGVTGDDPNQWLADLEKQINEERANLKAAKYDQEKAEKIQAALDKLQEVKQKIKTNMSYEEGYGIKPREEEGLFDAFDEEEGTPISPDLGFGSAEKAQAESKAFLAKHKKELNDAYNEYLAAAGIKAPVKTATVPTVITPKVSKVPFTPYTSQEEYEAHLSDPWSPAKAAAQQAWVSSPSYKKVVAPSAAEQAKSSGTGYKSPTATAADQATIIPTTGGGVSYEGPGTKTTETKTSTPATTGKVDLDSIAKQLGITTDELRKRLSIIQGAGQYDMGQKVPYRYRHRGYSNLLGDPGHIPTPEEIQNMMIAGKEHGYTVTADYGKPGLFGRRKLVLKSVFNPATGQIEQHPYSTPDSPGTTNQGVGAYGPDTEQTYKNLHPPAPAVRGIVENQMNPQGQDMRTWLQQNIGTTATPATPKNAIPYADPNQESPNVVSPFAYGGNLRMHQAGSQTGIYDWGNAEGYKIPQGASVEGTPNTMGKKGNEKAVYKIKGRVNPYTADYLLAAGNIAEGMLGAADTRAYLNKLKKMRTADYTQVASGKDMGDYGPTGQQYGAFRMNQTTPTFDAGYIPGMAGQAPIAKEGGSMSPYSYPSTLPVLPQTGMPAGDMSMYTHWNQRPVMGYGGSSNGPLGYFNKGGMPCMECGGYMEQGGQYEEGGVYDLSQDEINQIMANGGQIEYID